MLRVSEDSCVFTGALSIAKGKKKEKFTLLFFLALFSYTAKAP